MEITDLSWDIDNIKRNNSKLLPKSIRDIIVGKSGFGKTTLLLNLLLKPGWLDYNNKCLQVFGLSLFQPAYKIIKNSLEKKLPKEVILELFNIKSKIKQLNVSIECVIEEISKKLVNTEDMECQFFETADDIPDPAEINMNKNNLMIFDDLQETNQNKCDRDYSSRRHSNVDCFYLA